MSGSNQGLNLGATFTPGGFDDYYMPAPPPDVVSPAPKRNLKEDIGNIQDHVQRFELDASSPQKDKSPPLQPAPLNISSGNGRTPISPPFEAPRQANPPAATRPVPPHSYSTPAISTFAPPTQVGAQIGAHDMPNFSAFPKLQFRPQNVPETDEERENTLESARVAVLSSTDPEMQLAWAQDATAWVEACQMNEKLMAQIREPRPGTPATEHKIREDAMAITLFLADQQHPKADFLKGMWLEFGKFGLREDKVESFRCYKRSAEKGYARSEYRMGMQFEYTNEPMKALQHYNAGEALGDSASCYRIGMMSLLGQLGQPQNYERGISLIKQAADTADANAPQGAYVYGMLLARELPQIQIPELYLPKDLAQARIYVEKAAFLGFSKAQVKMGSAYELAALTCDFNPELSMHYNALASRQGEAEADMAISKWFLCGHEGSFHKNEELAFVYAQRATLSGLHMAEFALGYFYEIGVWVKVDLEYATHWYEKAAKGGNKDAQNRIEGIRNKNTLSKNDHEKVAVSRIKSTHGSKKGGRPERFTNKPVQLPPKIDEAGPPLNNAPTPAPYQGLTATPNSAPTPAPYQGLTATPAPPLGGRTTPYPLDDRPLPTPSVTPYPQDRAATTTPYPMDQAYSRMPTHGYAPSPVGAAIPKGPRPVSGFHLNVNHRPDRPASAFVDERTGRPYQGPIGPQPGRSTVDPPRQGARMPPPQQPRPLPRPYSQVEMGNTGKPLPPGQRVPSGPPQGYRQSPGPSLDRPGSDRYMNNLGSKPVNQTIPPAVPTKQQPPSAAPNKLDIGFTAPVDARASRNTQRTGTMGTSVSSNPSAANLTSSLPFKPQKTETSVSSTQMPPPGHGSQTGSRPNSRPNSRPGSSAGRAPMGNPTMSGALPATNTSPSSKSKLNQQPPPAQQSTTPAATKPAFTSAPGKGPKTFDEMGVPNSKQESECILM